MNRKPCEAVVLLSLAAVVFSAGCRQQAPSKMVLVTFSLSGASPAEVEESIVLPAEETLKKLPGVGEIHSVSSSGRALMYVLPAAGADGEALTARVVAAVEQLEADLPVAATSAIQPMPNDVIPPVSVTQTKTVHVEIDRVKAAAMGIDEKAISDAVARMQRRAEVLGKLTVETADGQTVRLGELVEITVTAEPSHRQRRWPPAK